MLKLISILSLLGCLMVSGCSQSTQITTTSSEPTETASPALQKVVKSEAEWKKELSADEYYILRKKGTERSFTGKYWSNYEAGIYYCVGCQLPLFESETKFKSGTGWPSFYAPIAPENIVEHSDTEHGMVRTEVVCGQCDGHLGHVFNDGPKPTGLRYCINGNVLQFEVKK